MKFADFLLINTKKETAPAPTGTVNLGSTRQCALVTPKRYLKCAICTSYNEYCIIFGAVIQAELLFCCGAVIFVLKYRKEDDYVG